MLEKYIERCFVDKIKFNGGECIKLLGVVGLPDRIILLPGGKIFFVEFKQKNKFPTKIQKYWIHRLNKLGFRVYIVDNKFKIEEILKEWNLSPFIIKKRL